jgi:hypothetical protein
MMPLLFVVDSEYFRKFVDRYSGSRKQFDTFRVTTLPDLDAHRRQHSWSAMVDTLIADVQEKPTRLVLVVAHLGVFADYLTYRDKERAEARVEAVEREVAERLGPHPPAVFAKGFHHMNESELSRLLEAAEDLSQPGYFARVRLVIEAGGGPLGKVSLIKHQLMRPFGAIRLLLQLEPSGRQGLDRELAIRVSSAMAAGRAQLEALAAEYEPTPNFTGALGRARTVLARDSAAVTADTASFITWVDELNDALDAVRLGAR